jgi:hypothetical protein
VFVDVRANVREDEVDLAKIKNRIIGSGEEQLDQIMFNPRNWRIHPLSQQDALKGVLEEVGWVQQVIVNKRTGNLIDGHLRCQLAAREGAQTIPVVYVDVSEDEEALVLATLDPIAAMAATDKQKLAEILSSVESENEQVNRLIDDIKSKEVGFDITTEEQKEAVNKEKPKREIDLIYTAGSIGKNAVEESGVVLTHCCLAVKSGWMYGVQSTGSGGVCSVANYQKSHKVQFIDQDYFNYDHASHTEAVKKHKPKYCTVRDIMTKHQCEEAGIKYYDFDTILAWAEELERYAENVIVIPKYDCIKDIPERFVLGYSVPTSHGGTPLPIELFKGRRVHLLGGSPNKQIAYWQRIPDDVVSIDNNYILKMANFGQAWFPDGTAKSVSEMGFGLVTNPLYIALVASLGNMAAVFWKTGAVDAQIQIDGGNGQPAEEE